MSIRLTVLYISVAILLVYAWKDWFKSLCGLILLMAIIQHEDMPKAMFGFQGFNVWNILFLGIFLSWVANRRIQGLTWDMPSHVTVLLLLYLGVILVGFFRAVFDRSYIQDYPLRNLISEELVNTVKWVLPGILLFEGCRTHRRLVMGFVCVLGMYFLIAVQVVKRIPITAVLSGDRIDETRKICQDIGYSAVDMSVFLAGTFWGILAALPLVRGKKYSVTALLVAAGIVCLGQALTGGRAGYIAWGATGLVLCLLKWRKYLILVPVIVILLPIVLPGPVERMLKGFGETDVAGQEMVDDYAMTSGRTLIWPYVVDKIKESPMVGYGRLGMRRTGLADWLMSNLYESFPHPHNMYLETLLDNGILGSIPILLFWAMVVMHAGRLFRKSDRLFSAIGGLALSLVLTQLFAGVGSQHFYPRESTFGMWVAIFLSLRMYCELKPQSDGPETVDQIEVLEFSSLTTAASGDNRRWRKRNITRQ